MMKIALRECKNCNRKTIQAEDKRPMQVSPGFEEMVKVWYCPNCGEWEYK